MDRCRSSSIRSKMLLMKRPLKLALTFLDSGICLAGGSCQLQGLVERLTNDLKMHVWRAEDPMTCVARGAGIILEDLPRFQHLLVDIDRSKLR